MVRSVAAALSPAGSSAGSEACFPHSSDYNPQDWTINLSELLRLIQLYKAAGYTTCAEGEDGFCPGAMMTR